MPFGGRCRLCGTLFYFKMFLFYVGCVFRKQLLTVFHIGIVQQSVLKEMFPHLLAL